MYRKTRRGDNMRKRTLQIRDKWRGEGPYRDIYAPEIRSQVGMSGIDERESRLREYDGKLASRAGQLYFMPRT